MLYELGGCDILFVFNWHFCVKLRKILKLHHEPKTELIPGMHCSCIAYIYEEVQYFCSATPETSVNSISLVDGVYSRIPF
jgi:hypothetical protein